MQLLTAYLPACQYHFERATVSEFRNTDAVSCRFDKSARVTMTIGCQLTPSRLSERVLVCSIPPLPSHGNNLRHGVRHRTAFKSDRRHAVRSLQTNAAHLPSLQVLLRHCGSADAACKRLNTHIMWSVTLLCLSQTAVQAATAQFPGLWIGAGVNSAVFLLGIRVLLAGLTPAGVANSWLLGTLVYAAFGWTGYLLVCIYFLLGSAVRFSVPNVVYHGIPFAYIIARYAGVRASQQQQPEATTYSAQVTKVKLQQKQREGIAEARSGRRSVVSLASKLRYVNGIYAVHGMSTNPG